MMSDDSDVGMASDEPEHNISDGSASQYWRELLTGLSAYPKFDGVRRSIDILTTINDLTSAVESLQKKEGVFAKLLDDKDKKIAKLQKRNESLSDILADELEQKRTSKTSESYTENVTSSNVGTGTDSDMVSDMKNKYQLLLDQKNTLYGHWKTVTNERETYKDRYDAKQSECDELKQELAMLKVGQPNNITTTGVKCDKDILVKRDENRICGIKFGRPRKVPFLMESNTIISNVKPGIPRFSEISVGDFVIEVNDLNVQHLQWDQVFELTNADYSDNDLKLKLRPCKHKNTIKTIGGHKSFNEWGLTFGVYVKEVKNGMLANSKGINEMDEVLKVNSHNIQDLSLKKIYGYMNKEVKLQFNHQLNPYDLNDTFSSQSSVKSSQSGRSSKNSAIPPRPSSINESPLPPPSGNHRPSFHSDAVSVSSGSSKQDSLCGDGSLRRNRGLANSQLLINNLSLTDLTLSGGSDPFSSGGASGDDSELGRRPTDSEIVLCTVKKYDYEAFGWTFIGGNKVGIYIKSIDNWSPIEKAGIGVGWRLLDIDGTKLEDVAFSFAMDYMSSLRLKTSIIVKVEKITREIYSAEISKRPYDNFHIRALVDYRKKSADETSFKAEDIFCVTDSNFIDANNILKWVAKNTNTGQSGIIPCQKSKFILNEDEVSGRRRSKSITVRYYDILDDVDVKTRTEDEEEGAF